MIPRWPGYLIPAIATTTTACNLLLGLDQYRDYCPPHGVGVSSNCVPFSGTGGATSSSSSATASGGSHEGGGGSDTSCLPCEKRSHASATCSGETCEYSCDDGWGDCDKDLAKNGCELQLSADKKNCGACGKTCFVGCKQGACNDPTSISVGFNHACSVLKDGSAWCWGSSDQGQLGNGNFGSSSSVPVPVQIDGVVAEISAGGDASGPDSQTCAVTKDGGLWCWGTRADNSIADGSASTGFEPLPVKLNGSGAFQAVRVAAGHTHGCAIDSKGGVWCWGRGISGELGTGMKQNANTPQHVSDGATAIAIGSGFSCLLDSKGDVHCAGSGLPSGTPMFQRVAVANSADEIAAGTGTLLIRTGESVYCFGSDYSNQCKISFTTVGTPTRLTIDPVAHIAAGSESSAFQLKSDASVVVWGNSVGPQDLHAKRIALGAGITMQELGCVIDPQDAVRCWNGGDGTTTTVNWP